MSVRFISSILPAAIAPFAALPNHGLKVSKASSMQTETNNQIHFQGFLTPAPEFEEHLGNYETLLGMDEQGAVTTELTGFHQYTYLSGQKVTLFRLKNSNQIYEYHLTEEGESLLAENQILYKQGKFYVSPSGRRNILKLDSSRRHLSIQRSAEQPEPTPILKTGNKELKNRFEALLKALSFACLRAPQMELNELWRPYPSFSQYPDSS